MEMRERIKEIRKHAAVTQAEFAQSLGLGPYGTANWEKKDAQIPTESMQLLICKTYGISKHWLETGEGEMLADSSANDPLDELCNQYKLSAMSRGIVKGFVELSEDQRAFFLQIARQVLESGAESADAELGEAVESASSKIIKEKHA